MGIASTSNWKTSSLASLIFFSEILSVDDSFETLLFEDKSCFSSLTSLSIFFLELLFYRVFFFVFDFMLTTDSVFLPLRRVEGMEVVTGKWIGLGFCRLPKLNWILDLSRTGIWLLSPIYTCLEDKGYDLWTFYSFLSKVCFSFSSTIVVV